MHFIILSFVNKTHFIKRQIKFISRINKMGKDPLD